MTDNPNIRLEATLTFKRNLDNLGKKYHSIRKDIKRIIHYLKQGNY